MICAVSSAFGFQVTIDKKKYFILKSFDYFLQTLMSNANETPQKTKKPAI